MTTLKQDLTNFDGSISHCIAFLEYEIERNEELVKEPGFIKPNINIQFYEKIIEFLKAHQAFMNNLDLLT